MVRWRALVLAALALVAAVGAALGPARRDRVDVSWPGDAEVVRSGDLWYTPLLLSSHRAERLSVSLPCPAADTLIFATGREAARGYRLEARRVDGLLRLRAGPDEAATVPWPAEAGCTAVLDFDGGDFVLQRGGAVVARGTVFAPSVSGFYSALAPGLPNGVAVELRGQPFASSPSARQWVLTIVALVLGAVAARGVWRAAPQHTRAARRRRDRYDCVVCGALGIAWVAAPLYFDDGWLMATVRARKSGGAFNNYYDTFATQLPLGFLHHTLLWPFGWVGAPMLWWRLVPLAASAGIWLLLRRALPALIGGPPSRESLLSLTAAFCISLFAWLMTLRPEPVVALLSSVVLVCALRYRTATARPAVVALVAAALAATLHPSGVVASAPLLLVIPTFWRRRRSDWWAAAVGVLLGATAGVLALFADTDVALWRRNRALFAADGFHSNGVFDEDIRYDDLLRNGTPARLVTVVFGLIVVLMVAVGWARSRGRYRNAAGAVLIVAALLLTLTPSKWIYHFGSGAALLVVALAVAAHEQAALRSAPRWLGVALPLVVALGVGRCLRSSADAQYFWRLDTADLATVSRWWIWLVIGAAALAAGRDAARRVALPAALVLIAVLTFVLHTAVPTVSGPAWAPGRRLVPDALRNTCGLESQLSVSELTDRLVLPALGAASGLPANDARAEHPHPLELPPVHVYATDVLGDDVQGVLITPWFEVGTGVDREVVVGFKGLSIGGETSVIVEWAAADRSVLERRPAPVAYPAGTESSMFGWRMVKLDDVVPRPPAGTLVRFVLSDRSSATGGFVAVTAPAALRRTSLHDYLRGATVISPSQMSTLWCAEPAGISAGVAAPPDAALGFVFDRAVVDSNEIGSGPSPWYLAEDAYPMRRVWVWLTPRDAAVMVVRNV